MTKFLLTKEEKCPECKGKGWITHPLWMKFHQSFDNDDSPGLDDPAFNEWWADKVELVKHGYLDIPDEEEYCFECDGDGVVCSQIEITENLLRELMDRKQTVGKA